MNITAYFEDSFEAFYGVVYRPEFETRLEEHFQDGISWDDPSWYALRNVVYASGCRTFLAKQRSVSWAEAQARSWPYFENALSVYIELLYTPTGLSAVRALAAMVNHNFRLRWPAECYLTNPRIFISKALETRLSKL